MVVSDWGFPSLGGMKKPNMEPLGCANQPYFFQSSSALAISAGAILVLGRCLGGGGDGWRKEGGRKRARERKRESCREDGEGCRWILNMAGNEVNLEQLDVVCLSIQD